MTVLQKAEENQRNDQSEVVKMKTNRNIFNDSELRYYFLIQLLSNSFFFLSANQTDLEKRTPYRLSV